MRIHTRALTAVAAGTLLLSASSCGGDNGTTSAGPGASRSVEVTMTDNAYQPTSLQFLRGETVTLRFRNTGAVRHEAILGDDAAQLRHHDEMTASTGQMEHDGGHGGATTESSSDAITVDPGKTGELTQTFTESRVILIGCHEPGHWEAGMKATITIT